MFISYVRGRCRETSALFLFLRYGAASCAGLVGGFEHSGLPLPVCFAAIAFHIVYGNVRSCLWQGLHKDSDRAVLGCLTGFMSPRYTLFQNAAWALSLFNMSRVVRKSY